MAGLVLRALSLLAAALIRGGRRVVVAAVLLAAAGQPALALIKGKLAVSADDGYGRIAMTFDQLLRGKVRMSGGILILDLAEPVSIDITKLPAMLPAYVSVARLDPDGRAIRLGLKGSFRPNLLEAGEKLFLDLLPPDWSGFPPALPPDVVEALAERARLAEERLRAVQPGRDRGPPAELNVRVVKAPSYTRLIFPVKAGVPVDFSRTDQGAALTLKGKFSFDPRVVRPDLPAGAKEITADQDEDQLKIAIAADKAIGMRGFREDDTFVLDIMRPAADGAPQTTQPKAAADVPPKPPAKEADAKPADARPAEPRAAERKVVEPVSAAAPAAAAPVANVAPADLKPVVPSFERLGDSLRITLPFGVPVPAAAFQRAGTVWLVFEDRQAIADTPLPESAKAALQSLSLQHIGSAFVLRLLLRQPSIINFAQQDRSWVATIGDQGLAAESPIVLAQGVGPEGRTILRARLPGVGAVHWLTDPDAGDTLAVITALGPARGLPKAQGFVEIKALPSAHGIVLSPTADDMIITAGLDDVTIGRGRGLTLSPAAKVTADPGGDKLENALAIDPHGWDEDMTGDIRAGERKLMREAADMPKRQRTDARLRLARFYLANGFYPEAINVLKAIAKEDETASANKPVQMTALMANTLARRLDDVRPLLALPSLANDPEARLWKAVGAAYQHQWPQALAGFRGAIDLLDRYPQGLQALLRPLVVEAAIEDADPVFADSQLALYEALSKPAPDPALTAMLHGRIAEALGHDQEALNDLQAAAAGNRMVEAAARLERVQLQVRDGLIERSAAIAELETIGAIWRRDEVEVRAQALLAKLYAEENRWRDAFGATRRAAEIMPDSPLTRGLQDEMAKTFTSMFLGGNDHGLSKIEALGLYYDFKSFTPPGRDGDEMVRHLADRLAGLDLLDQATELLKHQVDHRLDGLARIQVATRLAVLYLLNHKPAEAVEILRATRVAELPPELKRARLLLEARGLSDMSLTDLAAELLAPITGDDAARLRADVLWRGKRWREAGEAMELVLGDLWRADRPLSAAERADVLRAGVAYVLGDEKIGLDRLRSKYAAKMADSDDAKAFALISGDTVKRAGEFRDIARTVVSVDTLKDFLDSFRKRYPDIAGPPPNPEPDPVPPKPEAAHDEAKPDAAEHNAKAEALPDKAG